MKIAFVDKGEKKRGAFKELELLLTSQGRPASDRQFVIM